MSKFLNFDSDQERGEAFYKLQSWHFRSVILWVPCAIAVIALACCWANIFGQAGNFTDPAVNWQACFTQSQYITIPLNATVSQILSGVNHIKNESVQCIEKYKTTTDCTGTDGAACIDYVINTNTYCGKTEPTVVKNLQIPVGAMLTALSYIGVQCIIFSAAGLASLNRALRHPTWLPSTIAVLLWFVFAMFTYYTVSPILPVPNQTNATLFIFLLYASSTHKFEILNSSDNTCQTAVSYLWFYLALVFMIVAISVFNLLIAIRAEVIKFEDNNKRVFESLKNTQYPCILAAMAMAFYLIVAFSKAYCSNNTLAAITNYSAIDINEAAYLQQLWYPGIWFPFKQPGLDIGTVLYIATFMSIIRGYTVQSISAFRLAFVTSLVYCISSYPGIVGAMQFYHYNNFVHFDSCYGYFLQPGLSAFFGYPSLDQAETYCYGFRTAIGGSIGMLICMHAIVLASYFAFQTNSHRESLVGTPFESERYASKDFDLRGGDVDISKEGLIIKETVRR